MLIISLSFENKASKIKIENINFSKCSLLVGQSGIGKTQILEAIKTISNIAREPQARVYNFFDIVEPSFNGIKWDIHFVLNGNAYQWAGEFEYTKSYPQNTLRTNSMQARINKEFLKETRKNDNLFLRDKLNVTLSSGENIKLVDTQSAISLLSDTATLNIRKAFENINDITDYVTQKVNNNKTNIKYKDFDELRNSHIDVYEKMYYVQQDHKDIFNKIKDTYSGIFPFVIDIKIEVNEYTRGLNVYSLCIKEKKTDWISNYISKGMLKTFASLLYIYLSPKESVFLIDEFENSLGINCIDDIAEQLVDPENDYQVIFTSHHPYIINKIPVKNWQVVKRDGNIITSQSPKEAGLDMESKQDAFIKLLNLQKRA